MALPKLTPHQRDTLARYRKAIERTRRPVAVRDLGSEGAVWRLQAKGYLTITNRPGPRGGEHLYASLPALGLCFHQEHCGVTDAQRCPAASFRRSA